MAAGAVIENLSNRKLAYILSCLLLAQIGFFIVGGWYSPSPSSSMEFEMVRCEDPSMGASGEWFQLRPPRCHMIDDLMSFSPKSFDMREIVFIAQMPHVRNGVQLEYSPWFQFLIGLLHVDVQYSDHFKLGDRPLIQFEVRLGYREASDAPDKWNQLATANATRTLECYIDEDKKSEGHMYDCDPLDLFEMGANNYPFYLVNIRIPIDQSACRRDPRAPNCAIGLINGLRLVAIHQNGGFTLVWLWLKTLLTPCVVAAVYWFWNRVHHLSRKPLLLEKSILALGLALAMLDFPLEWLSLFFRIPCLLLISDIRQGVFYCVLLAFWLIFAGEHLIDDTTRNNISSYSRNLSLVAVSSLLLLLFDVAERGMQLHNPFHSVWSSETGSKIAYLSIYLACAGTVAYLGFLFYKIVKVWTSIRRKREAQLYRTCENRRLKVEAIIFRFKFLMLFTLAVAGMTVAAYIMKQHGEAQLHGDDPSDSWLADPTSAFFTGTFGAWNIYVLLLIAMYAPSHKIYQGTQQLLDEREELMDGNETESTSLTTFLKPATD